MDGNLAMASHIVDEREHDSERCSWRPEDISEDTGGYETDCGKSWCFNDGNLSEYPDVIYCAFCGRKIKAMLTYPEWEGNVDTIIKVGELTDEQREELEDLYSDGDTPEQAVQKLSGIPVHTSGAV